ncbi:TIM barrel protein [Gracilibacillus salitolerans]|uniref:TIM barrel protein n=1 Tax=Gracilibacillus salitolerans TaxID=2663022 RepID=A0A5Q2THN6_9BACI|nr:sugar phosphate isomerase/epimerase family protein [Gracilibacillus salitolerans]QGH33450.1 TIM barrel protein [Gracilibacillus salitolerans]
MKYAAFSGVFIEYSIQQAMVFSKELGFDGIEIACREPHLSPFTSLQRVKEIKEIADQLDLKIPVLGGYMGHFSTSGDKECEKALQEFKQIIEWANILDVGMIRVFPGGPNAFLAENYHYEKAAYWLKKCVEEAKVHGIKVLLEIHNLSLIETIESSKKLLKMVDEPGHIGLIHDAGNMYITDTCYTRESILDLRNQLFHVHVKDEKRIEEAGAPGTFTNLTKNGTEHFLQCLLEEGKVEHQPVFDSLSEIGYDKWVTLECAAPYPPKERLLKDLIKVKELINRSTHP